ncbi:MAG: formate dehydrogenase accessory sulfurtransferase FdhD [Gammaproteobacteria bacterium]|nr:formate dehydrogenase accessory sulfurtransferase FdhD [Gammaproteobacteria bacterium]
MSVSSLATTVSKISGDARQTLDDHVAVEEPLEIRLGFENPAGRTEQSVSITMRTPGHDAELATGFLFCEAIIRDAADIALVKACGAPAPDSGNHNVIRVELESGVDVDLQRLQRHFYTTSSCGVCGKTSLDALHVVGAKVQPMTGVRFSSDVITAMPAKLRKLQQTFAATGGLHAAAAFNAAGEIVACHEDVGRHNAVDKVIGALLTSDALPAADLGLIVSGRASFELMQKAVMAGMPLLAAVGAPSSLAVTLAREFNVTLVGFLRGDTFNLYAAGERVT